MELFNEVITEKSRALLFELKETADFILIGGWASWLYTKNIKSKDVDIYINFDDFFRLQNFFLARGISISFNKNLNKYEIKTGEIDIDIYTPDHCSLIIPCKEVLNKNLFKLKDNFKVVLPEVLLILKLDAEKSRRGTIKAFKDRLDILSLLYKEDFNNNLLIKLSKEHNLDLSELLDIIKKSNREYSYFFNEAENLRELKKLKLELLKKAKSFL